MKKSVPPRLRTFPPAKQRRLDALLAKNREGLITPSERTTLERLVAEAEQLMVANASRLADYSSSEAVGVPAGAVPVTVWVKPEPAER